jgi:hypothetical protein
MAMLEHSLFSQKIPHKYSFGMEMCSCGELFFAADKPGNGFDMV